MGTIIGIIVVVALIFGIVAFISSNEGDPKDRAAEAAGAAAGGAVMAGSCFLQLIVYGLIAVVGLWVLNLIFG